MALPGWARRGAAFAAVAQLVFVAIYVGAYLATSGDPPRPLDLDADGSIAQWASTLLLGSVTAAAIALRRLVPERCVAAWVVALGFAFLSLDEALGVHEWIGAEAGEAALGVSGRIVWPLIYLPLMLVIAIALLRLAAVLGRFPRNMVWTGLTLLALAVAAEGISGVVEQGEATARSLRGSIDLVVPIEVSVEESLEWLGVAAILIALVSVLRIVPVGAGWSRRDRHAFPQIGGPREHHPSTAARRENPVAAPRGGAPTGEGEFLVHAPVAHPA